MGAPAEATLQEESVPHGPKAVRGKKPERVIADTAYDSDPLRSAPLSTCRYKSRTRRSGQSLPTLLLEHFFDLSDLFLNFAGVFFGVAFPL